MDLLTPAQTWSVARPPSHSIESDAAAPARMPLLQQAVMFLSVAGPFAGLIVAIVLLWRRSPAGGGIGWPEVLAMLVMYALAGFGVTIGYHRLLTHRAFQTPRPVRLLLAILGSSAGQGMAINWIATHRRHHQLSDRAGDPHSPHMHGEHGLGLLRGLWHAHLGWCFNADPADMARSVPELLSDRAMLLIDRLYCFWVVLGLLLPAVALGIWSHSWNGFASGLIWGGIVRICLMQHVTWSINSVCHVWGGREFQTTDCSTNNFPIALLSLGEGWHNNHHAFPTSARHGLRWWQIDFSYMVIRAMAALGLAWEVRLPSCAATDAKRIAQQ
ncbi:MAG TPA: acyl-CoA desaturase [Tepidisphaeraceae bacterium]